MKMDKQEPSGEELHQTIVSQCVFLCIFKRIFTYSAEYMPENKIKHMLLKFKLNFLHIN